ncbi:MAG TPA: amidase domain-containing protein [Limnochordales bacterium]
MQARRITAAVAVLVVTAGVVWWGVRAMRDGQARTTPETLPEAEAGQAVPPSGATAREDDPVAALRRILDERARALIAFDEASLREHYDLDSDSGQRAFQHEQRRLRYLRAWADRRRLRMVSARSDVRVANRRVSGDEAWLSVVQSTRLGYVYRDAPSSAEHLFGIGTRHAIQMVRKDGRWVLRRDWYTDPLDEDTLVPDVRPADVAASGGILEPLARLQALGAPRCSPPAAEGREMLVPGALVGLWEWLGTLVPLSSRATSRQVAYDRDKAVAYARRYCGGAWGCGNGGRYNPAYKDYTDVGGDCTNFASQVLHAGGLPMDDTWYYRRGGGSGAWVQATGLLSYLLDAGRARLLARGTYADVVEASDRFPEGAIRSLKPGDLIAYQEQGQVVHFAVVTGQDARGYVVVDSHTADRRAVPWDVGWDQATVYWLLSVRD